MYGASHPTWQSDVATTMSLAAQARINVVRVTNFLNETGNTTTDPYDASRWALVDSYIAAAAQANLHVLLDLSTYRNLLWNACQGPAYDWNTFLHWVGNRVNTVNGRTYRQDPTIAAVALAGEQQPPGTYTLPSGCTISYTTSDLTTFYSRSLSELRTAMPNQLAETGGFLHLDYNAGIDWKTIMADPNDQVCALHVYSSGDATVSVPNVASYCASLNKPWIIEEFGFPQSDGDAARAQEYLSRITLAVTDKAAGIAYWNLGPETSSGSYDVNSSTPLTLGVVQGNAPS
jgi:Cellulase (glycosyl hydrolase family 5)